MRTRVPVANPHAARASGDRWLFGYADIVTLLLAVFASLYATGAAAPEAATDDETAAPHSVVADPALEVTSDRAEVIAVEAIEEPHPEIESDEAIAAEPDAAPLAAADALIAALGEIAPTGESLPGVEVVSSARGVVISLPEAGSFPAGSAELSDRATVVMAGLAAELRELPNLIRVEGHTDDRPIATAQYASNWDLSAARATRVVELLIAHGITPDRLAAAGYAEYRPRRPNSDAASRARNRRVDIVVLDPATAASEDPRETVP